MSKSFLPLDTGPHRSRIWTIVPSVAHSIPLLLFHWPSQTSVSRNHVYNPELDSPHFVKNRITHVTVYLYMTNLHEISNLKKG